MTPLDQKINDIFPGLVVRKDLVAKVKGNAIVPSYVLEYLLGQYCATSDEASIESGIETVRKILADHYVHRNESGLIRSRIREKGRYKVIDKVSVDLNDKDDVYEATFSNLGIKKVIVRPDTIKKHPKLLVGGVWCICDVEYEHFEDSKATPWLMGSIKPIQLSHFDFDSYLAARKQFTTEEWIDLLMQSIGFNPEWFGRRSKLTQLLRLIPFCERNFNLMELGPKGTGKSHIFSEFSPHGILISGGEVTVAKLFVNNASGRIGLVGYWDVVAFDEFAGKTKTANKGLVDIMKNFMANKTFSRGIETLGAEASMSFVGNTRHTVPYMLKHSDLFDELPKQYHDSAFLDRIHFYSPGWEIDIIRGEMFSNDYGFVVDYLAEILRSMRNQDFSHLFNEHFELFSDISTRDKTAIQKSFSGFMKILFPSGEAEPAEIEELLRFAIEGRKRVKDQLLRIDSTYSTVRFGFTDSDGKEVDVQTLEEKTYPKYYYQKLGRQLNGGDGDNESDEHENESADGQTAAGASPKDTGPQPGHLVVEENQRGVSYDSLFGEYLRGAESITLTDPYIRVFYQTRNMMEFLETVARVKNLEDQVEVQLVTIEDEFRGEQTENFEEMRDAAASMGITFSWAYVDSYVIHARHIVTDTGWKILLDRGLDIFQKYEMNNAFDFANRLQAARPCKNFNVTYLRMDEE